MNTHPTPSRLAGGSDANHDPYGDLLDHTRTRGYSIWASQQPLETQMAKGRTKPPPPTPEAGNVDLATDDKAIETHERPVRERDNLRTQLPPINPVIESQPQPTTPVLETKPWKPL